MCLEVMMGSKHDQTCNICGDELNDDNWFPSSKKYNVYRCKTCITNVSAKWVKDNADRRRIIVERSGRKIGILPMSENRKCSKFLGIHVAERVMRYVFKDVQVMPSGNPGFDIICNKDRMIDIKSSCKHFPGNNTPCWMFNINYNTTADYFLLLAFDNREYLNPLHVWLVPGHVLNYKKGTTISETTVGKWDEYKIDINEVITCCDTLKEIL